MAMDVAVEKGIRGAIFYPAAAARLVIRSSIQKFIDEEIIDNHALQPTKKKMFQLSPNMPALSTEHSDGPTLET
ncbi:hypothetical protein Patl1_21707 [Pistacia atlantica]|uniref:Uncharacterized protein n=1 Tax=Pistacia atlantica TaxID=434234 RepID=A0ACC1BN05_9ROSI|nr:hypothetical protein Patl1_21707 [Pistacia atlantica]